MFFRREFRRVHMTSTTPLLITLVAGFTPLLITLAEGFALQYVHVVAALAPLARQHHLKVSRSALHRGRQNPLPHAALKPAAQQPAR
jgi:hypothetical protein